MPPWVALVPRSLTPLRRQLIEHSPSRFRCCNAWHSSSQQLRIRRASTYVSPTAINARANIPKQNEELYHALSELSTAAGAYVNISRLQLAQRGLATQDAVARVAVLSLGSQRSAQKLARLLLADPLGTEGQWEKTLDQGNNEDGRAVLLRFGDELDAHTPSPLYKIISVPSKVLQAHNLEILVSTLDVNVSHATPVSSTENSQDAILVPKIQAPTARGLPVPYPVHKTLVLGHGVGSAVQYGRFTADSVGTNGDMVKVVIDLPAPESDTNDAGNEAYAPVNVDIATKALDKFRESIANSEYFERGWFKSGLPDVSKWLIRDMETSKSTKPAIAALIASIADEAEINITRVDAQQLSLLAASPSTKQVSESILQHLQSWAEKSHTELRDELDEAFTSRNWHKIAWWKLLWRVDDVGMITEDILRGRWLVAAERNAVFLAGRMNQAGYPEIIHVVPEIPVLEPDTTPLTEDTSTTSSPPNSTENTQMNVSTEVKEIIPWPDQIARSRTLLLTSAVPPLQALAQRLILMTLSTTSISSALSALLYVTMPTCSLFEAGAVAALGFVYSLRRMQKLWETAREQWQAEIREEGRRTLKQTEETVRLVVHAKDRENVNAVGDVGVNERKAAREAVRRVREALKNLKV